LIISQSSPGAWSPINREEDTPPGVSSSQEGADLIVLKDDKDFAAVASVIPEVRQVRVRSAFPSR
jgi:hypothetical protein